MGYPHITDLHLSHSFNNAKPSSFNHGDLVTCSSSNANEGSQLITDQQQQRQQQQSGSSRWNPTPEQLMTLEELYRRGTRTPSAAQIQQIAMRLRRFGKIEGKNVFYWFQNHKARERQKQRRQLNPIEQQCDTESLENKESGFEIEPINNKGSPSNKDFISTHGIFSKSEGDEWNQIHEKELRVDLSSSPVCLINSSSPTASSDKITSLEDEDREDQTLELFPLGSNDINDINNSKNDTLEGITDTSTTTTTFTPNKYFEFLPLKN